MGDEYKEMTPAFSKARKKVMDIVQHEDVGRLGLFFKQYSQELIKKFFLEEGLAILKWSVAYIPRTTVLVFLTDNLPKEILKEMLYENDCEVLESFLMTEFGGEKFNKPEQRPLRIEKFKLLLKIDAEGVKEFMDKHGGAKCVTKKIIEDFETAQRETFQSNISYKLVP